MRSAHAAIGAVLIASAGATGAQPPPAVDTKTHPQLAAMRAWLESGAPGARHCAMSGGLFLEAVDLHRGTQSEPATVDAMMRAHGDKLSAPEQERLRGVVVNVVSLATALSSFDRDSAAVAYTQMCVARAQRPDRQPGPDAIRAQLESAQRCEQRHAAGSLDRKECVAAAFRLP